MPEFSPIQTVMELRTLDEAEVLLGYMDGFDGCRSPGSGASRSFHHGWRNGMVDAGLAEMDDFQVKLAEELRNGRAPQTH